MSAGVLLSASLTTAIWTYLAESTPPYSPVLSCGQAAAVPNVIATLLRNPVLLQKQPLQTLQQQLYEELSKTPEHGQAFTDVVKTVMDRETAFVSWKSEGAPEYWQKQGPGLPAAQNAARKLLILVLQSMPYDGMCIS